jgi:hypothetical protein
MATRRRRRRNNAKGAALVIGGMLIIALAHLWAVFFMFLILGAAVYVGPRITRRSQPPVKGPVTYHAEMNPEDLARTKASQRSRVIALGPNATESDRKAFQRDNPGRTDDEPPF